MGDRNDLWTAYSMTNLVDSICANDFSLQQETIDKGTKPSYAQEHLNNLKNNNFKDVRYAFIAYGINDFHSGRKIGTLNPNIGDDLANFNRNTYIGATQYVVEKLQKYSPNTEIILCSLKRTFDATKVINLNFKEELPAAGETNKIYFIKNEFKSYIYDSITSNYVLYDGNNMTLFKDKHNKSQTYDSNCFIRTYNQGLKDVAELYGLRYIDLYNIGINQMNADHYYKHPDGTHPNQIGRNKIALEIANQMKSWYAINS